MLSNNVSNFGLKAQKTGTICTCASYVILLLEFIANCLVDGAFSTPIDSTCKAMPLVNGATTTSSSLIGKFKSKEWLRTFVNKVKFTLLALLCKPLSVLKRGKYELFTTLAMAFFLVLDFCFVLFCAYAAMRTFCPNFADSIGLTDFAAVSNIKEVKGIRQCYLYLKQQFFFVA